MKDLYWSLNQEILLDFRDNIVGSVETQIDQTNLRQNLSLPDTKTENTSNVCYRLHSL